MGAPSERPRLPAEREYAFWTALRRTDHQDPPALADQGHRATHTLRHHAQAVAADHPHITAAVLDRAIDIDPDDEDLHSALIRHHLHHGDTEAARRAYARYTDHMRRLGTPLDQELRDIIEKPDGE